MMPERIADALLNQMPIGRAHRRIAALCFAAWIFDFYDLTLYSFLLVPVARELHLSPAQSSLALGTSLLMTAAGGVLFGFIGDRFGRRPAIAATVAIYGLGTLMCAASRSLGELIVWRSIAGLGIGGGWAPGQSLVAETVPPQSRASYAAFVQTGSPLGVLLAAAVSGYVEPLAGWRWTFALSAMPAAAVMIAVLKWLPESDVWLRSGGGEHLGRADFAALRPYRRIIALTFFVTLLNSQAYWFTYSWLPGYLELTRGLTQLAAGRRMIGMQVGAVAGYAIFGMLADRYGRRPMFCVFGMIMAAGLLPTTILWDQAIRARGVLQGAMVAAGFGTGIWSGVAPMISELLPTRVRTTALGMILNVTRGFQFFTPIFITAMSAHVGFAPTLALGALFAAAGAMMIWTLPETRGRIITALDEA